MKRTEMVKVQGVESSYKSRKDPSKRLDVSELKQSCYLASDAFQALIALKKAVNSAGGNFYVTELFRPWALQDQAHKDWLAKKRKDFASPAGESFHQAGRAIDIDIYNLNLYNESGNSLQVLWDLAIPLGWQPIIGQPQSWASEAWHFEFYGQDWEYLATLAPNKIAAQSAVQDAGQGNPREDTKTSLVKFIQSQCNRLLALKPANKFLTVDGVMGSKTKLFVKDLLNENLSDMDKCATALSKTEITKSNLLT